LLAQTHERTGSRRMTKVLGVAVLAMLVGCEPEPGETRCSTTMVFGTAIGRGLLGRALSAASAFLRIGGTATSL
jgi:hypothetical protein